MIRVLVSLAPRSYRESVALALHNYRPGSDVRVAPPDRFQAEARTFEPHMIVFNDESYPELDGIIHSGIVRSTVEILFKDHLHANISVDGHTNTIKDVGMDDLLQVLDATQTSISGDVGYTDEIPELPRES